MTESLKLKLAFDFIICVGKLENRKNLQVGLSHEGENAQCCNL